MCSLGRRANRVPVRTHLVPIRKAERGAIAKMEIQPLGYFECVLKRAQGIVDNIEWYQPP